MVNKGSEVSATRKTNGYLLSSNNFLLRETILPISPIFLTLVFSSINNPYVLLYCIARRCILYYLTLFCSVLYYTLFLDF